MSMIEVKSLTAGFGDKIVLENILWTLESNQCCLLLGKNGSGKTTLLRCLIGLIKPMRGEIYIDNHNVEKDALAVKKIVGVISDDNPLVPDFSALQYLDFVGILHNIPTKERIQRIEELFKYFFEGLDDLKRPIHSFSTGMKKKLSFCAAVLHRPKLLLLDEPFNGLDPETQKKALNFLKAFRDQGNTILLTSHFFSGLHEIVTDIALLDNRQIISAGSVDDFLVNQLASEWKEVLSTFF